MRATTESWEEFGYFGRARERKEIGGRQSRGQRRGRVVGERRGDQEEI